MAQVNPNSDGLDLLHMDSHGNAGAGAVLLLQIYWVSEERQKSRLTPGRGVEKLVQYSGFGS